MSWNDPCSECGKPRRDCECVIEPPTDEQLKIREKENIRLAEARKICEKEGHVWEYVFIVYGCKRCGETTQY